MELTRKAFMQTVAGAAVTAALPKSSMPAAARKTKMKLSVTAYSYGSDIREGSMTFDSVVADVADMGCDGIELLGETSVQDYPNPSNEWVAHWFSLLDKYKLKPSAYDTFVDTMFYRNRNLTSSEAAGFLERDFKLAHRLGFRNLRQQWPPYKADDPADEVNAPYVMSKLATETIMKALPLAEKYDVRMGIELHSPTQLKSKFIDSILETIHKTGTKHLGFTPDFSSFVRRPPRNRMEGLIKQGAHQKIVDYIVSAYQNKLGPEKTVAEVKKMGGNDLELQYAGIAGIYHFSNNDPKDLAPLVPYCFHVHAKYYEITDDLKEYSIPYDELLNVLAEGGYDQYLSSEFEGSREGITISAALRAHQAMMRSILGMI
jgi:sugar phosphate isomerase/epimerase